MDNVDHYMFTMTSFIYYNDCLTYYSDSDTDMAISNNRSYRNKLVNNIGY